ncbi:MAG: hypothetical protein ABI461_16850 [Polyangiaceae bacterium]
MAGESKKIKLRLLRIGGIGAGVLLITGGMLSAPRIGNYSMLFTLLGITVAVVTFVGAMRTDS